MEFNIVTLKGFAGVGLSIGLIAFSQSALALSCIAPDLGKAMETAKNSPLTYHVFVGKFVTPNYPKQDMSMGLEYFERKSPILARSWFKGISLAPEASSDAALSRFPVGLEVGCAGPWCGAPPNETQTHIAFVEARSDAPPILRISACRSQVFTVRDGDGQVERLRACFDKTCLSDQDIAIP